MTKCNTEVKKATYNENCSALAWNVPKERQGQKDTKQIW